MINYLEMGLDLKLLPQYGKDSKFSADIIQIDRNHDLFDLISTIEHAYGRDIDGRGWSTHLGETGEAYGTTTNSPYGKVLKTVPAKALKGLIAKDDDSAYWRNKAAIAYLNELPDDLEVMIYWH